MLIRMNVNVNVKAVLVKAVVVSVVLGAGGVSYYFYSQYRHAQELLKNPTAAASEELKSMVNRVGGHMMLPTGESPTLATVSDKSKLADQPFFAHAETGDKVLIYTQAGKVILYRPKVNKIVEVASVNPGGIVAGANTQQPVQLQAAKLAILNSTERVGLASVAEKAILTQIPALQTYMKANSKGSFDKSTVVILNPAAQTLGKQLSDFLHIQSTSTMPVGENKPDSDLVLIVGQDFQL